MRILRTLSHVGAAALLAAGCARQVGPAPSPSAAVIDAFLARPSAEGVEGTYVGSDGAELGFVGYRATAPSHRAALVYLHGIESHAGWFDRAARLLAARGYDVFCLDRRGSGINGENRGFPSGHSDSWETLLADVEFFVRPLAPHYETLFVVGLSWGGKLALAYGLTHPEPLDGLVLITPGLRARVDLSVPQKLQVGLASVFHPRATVPTPIEPEMFTTTPRHLEYIRNDPLRLRRASASFFMGSRDLDRWLDRHVAGNEVPTLLFLAGRDRIIDNEGVVEVLERGREHPRIVRYEDQTHSIQFDAPERLVGDMDAWLGERIEAAAHAASAGP